MNITKFPFLQRAKCAFCGDTVLGCISDTTCLNDKFYWFRTTDNKLTLVYADSLVSYIGQCDNDGCYIFEGDIIKYTFDFADENEKEEDILVVCYNEKASAFCLYNKNGKSDEVGVFLQNYKIDFRFTFHVIGNIYDNPELVEGWKNPEEFVI